MLTIRAAVNACQRTVNAPVDSPEPRLNSANAAARPDCQRVNAFPRPPPPTPAARRRQHPHRPRNRPAQIDGDTSCLPGHTDPTEIGRLWRSQRATRTPTAEHPPRTRPDPIGAGDEPSVALRLHGTPPANRATVAALATVLVIQSVSRPYPDRPPSTKERIYVTAELPPAVSKEHANHV